MRIAVAHDWMPYFSGAERVVEEITHTLDVETIYTLFDKLSNKDRRRFRASIQTTFLQRVPYIEKIYTVIFPVFPFAVEQIDLSKYDIVVSSSTGFAKGILSTSKQIHICYLHSPPRYAWDLYHEHMRSIPSSRVFKKFFARILLSRFRIWDYVSSNRVDYYIANSCYIASRIEKTYGRKANVVYPPVETKSFTPSTERGDFFITACRLVAYKRLDVIINAFAEMPDKTLYIIGRGPLKEQLMKTAPNNVVFLGHVPVERYRDLFQTAKAFIYAAVEDFGIVMAEAQAAGCPVIAYDEGGAREIVRCKSAYPDAATGVLYAEQDIKQIVKAVRYFEDHIQDFNAVNIARNAQRFDQSVFRRGISEVLDQALQNGTQRAKARKLTLPSEKP